MKKKITIIGMTVAFIAATTLMIVLFITRPSLDQDTDTTGSSLPLADTPDYKACQVINPTVIKATFNPVIDRSSDGVRSGTTAPNDQKADQCTYTLTSKSDSEFTLAVQVYPYSVESQESPAADPIDESWFLMSESRTPSYYQVSETATSQVFTMRVVDSGKNYRLVFSQPKGGDAISDSEIYVYMLALSNATTFSNITASDGPTDAPPPPEY